MFFITISRKTSSKVLSVKMQQAVEPAWVLSYLLKFWLRAEPENLDCLDFLAM